MRPIVFTGGGTGGHVYPALAVYESFSQDLQERVVWIGSHRGIEREIVTAQGIPYHGVAAGKLRRYFDLQNVVDAFKVLGGIVGAWRLLGRLKPTVVFSKGGYVAVPVVLAAAFRKIPVVIHESDRTPGLATRITARYAARICLPYEDTAEHLPTGLHDRIVVTGNPVRLAFRNADGGDVLNTLGLVETDDPVVFVTGGSQGAQQLNEWVAETITDLARRTIVIHQTGTNSADMIQDIAVAAPEGRYYGAPGFTDLFPMILARADLVVARAGAGTIWEIAAVGRPAILVPLSRGSSRGDQVANARAYASAGAAVVLEDPDTSADTFLSTVLDLLGNTEKRRGMASAAAGWGGADAARAIADTIEDASMFEDTSTLLEE